jgi:predicted transcriptional regulator
VEAQDAELGAVQEGVAYEDAGDVADDADVSMEAVVG